MKQFFKCIAIVLLPIFVIAVVVAILAAVAVGLTRLGIDDEFSMLIVLLIAGAILGVIFHKIEEWFIWTLNR